MSCLDGYFELRVQCGPSLLHTLPASQLPLSPPLPYPPGLTSPSQTQSPLTTRVQLSQSFDLRYL